MKSDFVDFPLERRRLRGGIILAFDIFCGRFDLPQAEFFETLVERDLRGHDSKFHHRSLRFFRGKAVYSDRLPSMCLEFFVFNKKCLCTSS